MTKRSVIHVGEVLGFSPPGEENKYVSRMLVDDESVGSRNLTVNHFTLFPGQKTYSGTHPEPYDEVYYILSGEGIMTLGEHPGEQSRVSCDTVVFIPAGMNHQLENVGEVPLQMITIMPLLPRPGANLLYDARKQQWGTSFRRIESKGAQHEKDHQ